MNEILQEYKDFVWGRHSKLTTRLTYINHPKTMLRYLQKPLDQITQADIDRYVQYCYDTKKHNGNVIRFYTIAKFLEWCGKKDLIVPKLVPKDAGKQALNEEETDKLLSTIEELSPLHRLVFYLEYDTIRRPSEIRKLKLSDRYGHILRYDGKRGIKQCVMTERLMRAWDDYLKVRPFPQTEEDSKHLVLVDIGCHKGRRIKSPRPLTRIIKEVSMYSNIETPNGEKPTNYLIKRTSITRQLKECHDPKIIQLQAGHTSLKPTMKYNRIEEADIKNYLTVWEHKDQKINEKKTSEINNNS